MPPHSKGPLKKLSMQIYNKQLCTGLMFFKWKQITTSNGLMLNAFYPIVVLLGEHLQWC
jgi:hypothetical protein